MKIALLGGASCFAQNFANAAVNAGHEVFGIGRRAPKAAPFWLVPEGYQYHVADLVDHHFVAMGHLDRERPEIIVNFAAQGEGAASFGEHAPDFFRTNCFGLARIVEQLRRRDYLKQFIHISTSELYGSTEAPAKESDPLRPTSPYAISKAAFDQYLEVMHRIHGFPATIVRPSNCYCPGQQLHRVIPKAIVCARSGRKLPLEGGGIARKSYLHADDLSWAILGILLQEAAIGRTFNVGPFDDVNIHVVVSILTQQLGLDFNSFVDIVPDRVGQDRRYWINSNAIRNLTGWCQRVNLHEGLATMIEWVDQYPELLAMPTTYTHVS